MPDDLLETMKAKAVAYISEKYGISPRNIEITQNVGGISILPPTIQR